MEVEVEVGGGCLTVHKLDCLGKKMFSCLAVRVIVAL